MADKRYLVFEMDHYYPSGGLADLAESFDDLKEAFDFAKQFNRDWYEIYDRVEGEEVFPVELRFDMRNAYKSGFKDHPQKVMKKLGYEIIKSEAVAIADCWIFFVRNTKMPLEPFLTQID